MTSAQTRRSVKLRVGAIAGFCAVMGALGATETQAESWGAYTYFNFDQFVGGEGYV